MYVAPVPQKTKMSEANLRTFLESDTPEGKSRRRRIRGLLIRAFGQEIALIRARLRNELTANGTLKQNDYWDRMDIFR